MATFYKTINSPIGTLILCSDESLLRSISFDGEVLGHNAETPEILNMARIQLEEYFCGTRHNFDIPLNPEGSEFQHRVWELVSLVKFGATKSYIEIARSLGSENYCRAIGMANGRNPLPIVVPCHRIIGNNGKLTGYAGGLERKKWLLLHEQKYVKNNGLFS